MREQQILFKNLKAKKDYWTKIAVELLDENTDLEYESRKEAYIRLRELIKSEEDKKVYEQAIDDVIRGVMHSIMVMFDGGDSLTDEFRIDVLNADTKESLLDYSALHEEFIGYLLDNGEAF